jgi:hypothetical protein
MSEGLVRYFVGAIFGGIAILLVHVHSELFALIPAGTSVYILGSLLLDVWRGDV